MSNPRILIKTFLVIDHIFKLLNIFTVSYEIIFCKKCTWKKKPYHKKKLSKNVISKDVNKSFNWNKLWRESLLKIYRVSQRKDNFVWSTLLKHIKCKVLIWISNRCKWEYLNIEYKKKCIILILTTFLFRGNLKP